MSNMRPAMLAAEMMIALFVTALIGLASMSAMRAASYAHQSTETNAETIQSARAGLDRVQRTIREARLVTESTSTELVLWGNDRQDLGYINCDEIGILRYNSSTQTITVTKVTFPSSMSDATKRALNVQVDFSQLDTSAHATTAMANATYRGDTILAANVTSCTFAVDQAVPLTGGVTVTASFGSGNQKLSMVSTTALRASATNMVEYDDDTSTYVMNDPPDNWGDLPAGGNNGGK